MIFTKKKRIAVFDTNPKDCARTASAIRAYYARLDEGVIAAEFTDRECFILTFGNNHYDMAFFGMNSVLDVDVARSIAAIDPDCPRFFVSDIPDYSIEAFRLDALDYLIKPVAADRLGEAVRRIGFPLNYRQH